MLWFALACIVGFGAAGWFVGWLATKDQEIAGATLIGAFVGALWGLAFALGWMIRR